MKSQFLVRLSAVVCVALLVACSSTPKPVEVEKPKVVELGVLLDQAAASEKAGQKDGAVRQYQEAAKLYPASKLPWSKIAQIQYDSANYGEAIVAAQQVVARDEKDKVAHSILSVSGLRVSTKALADLSKQNELTGSVRSEAQSLAKVLRESLGESVLVPTQTVVESPRAVSPAPRPAAPRPTRPAPAAAAAPSAGGGNPFGALK
jgi:hypothetical protein